MLDERFIVLAVAVNVVGTLNYIAAVLKGRAKPNRVTWALWSVAPYIAFFASLDEGVGLTAWFTFSAGFNPTMVLIASFIGKNASWELKARDYALGALSVAGLILWQITGEGAIAILFAVLADFFAATPTLIKAFQAPETESSPTFLFCAIASVIALLTVDDWMFAMYAFPLYSLLICSVLFSTIQFKLGSRLKSYS